jgi:stage III sporulation protein SpoIIIAA
MTQLADSTDTDSPETSNESSDDNRIVDDLQTLVSTVPEHIQTAIRSLGDLNGILEVVLDLGRLPEVRFPGRQIHLDTEAVTSEDIDHVVERVGNFGDDNRAGIERTLHRISVIRNRIGKPVGLTLRFGRAIFGTIKVIEDFVFSGESILLMGRPGVGKTTMLREIARVLADDAAKRVIVVDTSNEIAGDGDVPHPAIGSARRMQVPSTPDQHNVMIEAVENHMPEVIIIDEMSTVEEALAARTIAERGVQLIATAHGNTLENLISNPTLSDLIGGTQAVTLGDVEARRRRTQKTVIERKQKPTFTVIIEINDWNNVGVHRDVASVVDDTLRGYATRPELRWLSNNGELKQESVASPKPQSLGSGASSERRKKPEVVEPDHVKEPPEQARPDPEITRIVAFGIPRPLMQDEADGIGAAVEMVRDLEDADMLVTTKAHYGRRPRAVRNAEDNGLAVYVLRKGTTEQVRRFLRRFESTLTPEENEPPEPRKSSRRGAHKNSNRSAMQETESAVKKIEDGETSVELAPQSAFVRRLQHSLANRNNVGSASVGTEPERRVVLRRRR